MKTILYPWLVLFLAAPFALAADCPTHQRTEAALLGIEHTWAESLANHDVEAVACLLTDTFEDAGVDGSLSNREQVLTHIPHRRPGKNQLSELAAHVFGDVGYVRGLNTVADAQGNEVAKVRFTDIFVYREGRWRAVAGQETLVKTSPR
ncbi:MAG TPA: nuclear transport factor 2 family protein [Terriglobales bacterium]|nr:nuclear transport factor 2 family protein [Terriglobales bacterium]